MLTIIGLVAIIVCAIQAWKAAAGTDRNPPLWTVLVVATGIAFQIIVPVLLVIVIAAYYVATGTPPARLDSEIGGVATFVGIVGIVLSVIGMGFILRRLARLKDDDPPVPAPPPPPTFR
jgi:hypothetical protein